MPSKQLSLYPNYNPQNLFLDDYDYRNWSKKEEELAGTAMK